MGKSARVLGWEFGLSSREMNKLLKEHGYLEGNPGAYGLTEKGKRYAEEQYHSRGTGGYAQYNPHWETRTWNDETAAALKADMEANPGGVDTEGSPPEEGAYGYEPFMDYSGSDNEDDEGPQPSWKGLAIRGAIIGGLIIAPYVKPYWGNKAKPAMMKLRDKVTKRMPVESTDS